MRRATDGNDVGRAIAIQIASAQVLGGDVAVDHGLLPFLIGSIEVIHRNPMVLAAVAGEDLLVAVAIDVGDPEGVAVGQGIVDDGARPKLERAWCDFGPDDNLGAVPRFDRGDKTRAVGAAKMDLAATPLGRFARRAATRRVFCQVAVPFLASSGPKEISWTPSLSAVRISGRPSPVTSITSIGVKNKTRGQFLENELSPRCRSD